MSQAAKVTSDRIGGRGARGYLRVALEPVWHRLGIGRGATGASGASGETGAEALSITGCTGLTGSTGCTGGGYICSCGEKLLSEESIARGYCERCHLASKPQNFLERHEF